MNLSKRPLALLVITAATLAASIQQGCESTNTRSANETQTNTAAAPMNSNSDVIQFNPARMDAKAKAVWDRSIKASMSANAKDHWVKNMKLKGVMSMPAQGIAADMTILIVANQGMRIETDIPGLGAFSQGVSNGVVWSSNMMEGPKILEGDEAEPFLKQNDLYADLHWEDYYRTISYAGEETVTMPDGSEVETSVLNLLAIDDETESTNYYDNSTGLLVKALATVSMAGASIPTTTYNTDYRDVQGITLPFKAVTNMGPVQQVVEFSEITINNDIDPDALALPEEIKELLED